MSAEKSIRSNAIMRSKQEGREKGFAATGIGGAVEERALELTVVGHGGGRAVQ
jgi:hypothetical protein